MTLRLDKYSIAGIAGVIFFISLGVYGLQEEKIEKKVQIDYQEVLKTAEERVSNAVDAVNEQQSKCSELLKNENETGYKLCTDELDLMRIEFTHAHVDLNDIKSELGLE